MALVPKYIAKLTPYNYDDIVDWDNSVTYTRPQPNTIGMLGHVAPAYSETKGMLPLMAAFADPAITSYPNDGKVSDRPYSNLVSYESPLIFGATGDWNLGLLIQAQMSFWQAHKTKMEALKIAVEGRMIEDTWITARPCLWEGEYDDEVAIASYNHTSTKIPFGYHIMDDMDTTVSGEPSPTLEATPCNMAVKWNGRRRYYLTEQEITNVIAFSDPSPVLEPVEWEDIPGGKYTTVNRESDFNELVGYTPLSINGAPIDWNIQPCRYEDSPGVLRYPLTTTGAGSLFSIPPLATPSELESYALAYYELVNPGTIGERIVVWLDPSSSDVGFVIPYYSTTEWGPVGSLVSGTIILADVFPSGWTSVFRKIQARVAADPIEIYPFGNKRPKKWKHDDPEFEGYVPYTEQLWEGQRPYLEDYARNPDDRFDAFYFTYKIKVGYVTRAWQAVVYNKYDSSDVAKLPLKTAELEQTQWYDTETGEYTLSGNACTGMIPITSDNWLSPGVIGPIVIPGFDWEGYDWPATSVTIPAGTFLLEDGSPAPIYPTFYGAYVYDLHLKKWGKFDGEYKRLLDYSAINTYLPSQQSYTRFGIFGGILTEDGKIRIFDEFPAVSQITYGKIGYYRQGMTSLEEVRVHHREFKSGSIKIESSVEGKLIDGAFTLEEPFIDSSSWIKKGGYSAKWHNITIIGQFDLSYLEFRGITTGKR